MSEQVNLDTIRNIEFFNGLSDQQLEELAGISREIEFRGQESVFKENDPATDLYVIVSGRVSLVTCLPQVGCRQMMEIKDGELMGWSAVLQRSRMTDTAQTLAPTKVIAFDSEKFNALCAKDTTLGHQLMLRTAQVLAERLYATRVQFLKAGGSQLPSVQIESD